MNPGHFVRFAEARFAKAAALIQLAERLDKDFRRGNVLVYRGIESRVILSEFAALCRGSCS